MADPLIVGLTGGIASGKTTVSDQFASLGVPVIDSDEIAREVVAPGSLGLNSVIEHFGPRFLTEEGTLNRPALRAHIFADPEARHRLESLLHPLIRAQMLEQARHYSNRPYILFVIPLIHETGQQDLVDRVLLIDCPEPVQRERLRQRDRISEAMAESIISSQASRQQRLQIADDIILNATDLDRQRLPQRVEQLHHSYLQLSSDKNAPATLQHP